MKKNVFIFPILAIFMSLMVSSCRVEDGFVQDKQDNDKRFSVFVGEKENLINYADGFAFLMKRYDSLYQTNFSGINNKPVIRLSANFKGNILNLSNIKPYVEFDIRSQVFKEENGDKWVVFPRIEDKIVTGLVVSLLSDNETYVSQHMLDDQSSFYKDNLTLFQSAINSKYNREKSLSLNASLMPFANGDCGNDVQKCGNIQEVILTRLKVPIYWVIRWFGPSGNAPGGKDKSHGPGGGGTKKDDGKTDKSDGGECGAYMACKDGKGGTERTKEETLCSKVSKIGRQEEAIALFKTLQGKTGEKKEYGYVLAKNGKVSAFPLEGEEGKASIDFSVNGKIDGFIHSHYKGLLSIFSVADIFGMATLYKNGNIKDVNTFVIGVVTASGTQYMLIIDNLTKFDSFTKELFTGNTVEPNVLNAYQIAYEKIYGISTQNTVENNENLFVRYLASAGTGLKLIKGTPDMKKWSLLDKDANGNVVPSSPCL
ncbi:hypothetical protein [Elizabethkingia meningoseptica]|uniref:hypothetical protein n=1 Tax=Elizabethkingia meningoseptica TaxID=238 RepID=UPI0023B1AE7F|nr:hypothetical protein [Elizabethkingia meningoseptica]MDE5429495.1 hypothetical protein [Elizabethkingia meningoseptica]